MLILLTGPGAFHGLPGVGLRRRPLGRDGPPDCPGSFFTAIEITHIEDPEVRERVRDLVKLARLSVGYGAHPDILRRKLNINALNEAERESACAALRRYFIDDKQIEFLV